MADYVVQPILCQYLHNFDVRVIMNLEGFTLSLHCFNVYSVVFCCRGDAIAKLLIQVKTIDIGLAS